MKNIYKFGICYRLGRTIAVKSRELGGNTDAFMPIFSADALAFAVAIWVKLELKIQFAKNVPYST